MILYSISKASSHSPVVDSTLGAYNACCLGGLRIALSESRLLTLDPRLHTGRQP